MKKKGEFFLFSKESLYKIVGNNAFEIQKPRMEVELAEHLQNTALPSSQRDLCLQGVQAENFLEF